MTTSADLLLQLRTRLKDFGGATEDPLLWQTDDSACLWSNAELYGFLAQAQDEFCTRRPIRDKYTISIRTGEPEYRLPDLIYLVEEVRLASTDEDLIPFNHHTEASLKSQFFSLPTWYAIDLREQRLRVYPAPPEDDKLVLRVARFPSQALSAKAEPEIPVQYHRHLLDWACYLAYQKTGAETLDYDQAGHFRSRFDAAVGPQISVNHQEIRRDIANRRLRTTAYYR